jgi:hypothetical protein
MIFASKLGRLHSIKDKGEGKAHEAVKYNSESESRHHLRSHIKAPLA